MHKVNWPWRSHLIVYPGDVLGRVRASGKQTNETESRKEADRKKSRERKVDATEKLNTIVVCGLPNVPATCKCISGLDLLSFTCCHTEIEAADPTLHLTQSQYTDTRPTSPSTDPITPGAWQGSHWSANFEVAGMTRPRKIPSQAGFEPGIFRS